MKEPNTHAQACVIWMHGLGADATDMMGLSEQLQINDLDIRHVFIDAPQRPVTLNNGMIMPAWYDILGMELTDREDKPGIEQSAKIICDVIEEQIKSGIKERKIYLAGFSQGGAMAIYTALNYKTRLGGVIALSAYLPLATQINPCLDKTTPFFIASGQFDPIVLPMWTQQTKEWLTNNHYTNISFHNYPMEHSICYEELIHISDWLAKMIKGDL